MMRTAMAGLLGALVLFVFSWYRGDLGAVDLGALGAMAEPGPRMPTQRERLAGLDPRARALGGAFADADARAAPARAVFFTGQLIAFPAPERRLPPLEPDAVGGDAADEAAPEDRVVGGVAQAVAAAAAFGDARPTGGGAILIELDAFGLDGPSPVADASWPAVARLARDDGTRCDEEVDEARAFSDPVYAVACVIAALEASGHFAWIERNDLARPAALAQTRPPGAARPQRAAASPAAGDPERAAADEPTPNDPLFPFQWHLGDQTSESPGGGGFAGYWRRRGQQGDRDVVAAVIDAGLDRSHPDLAVDNLIEGMDFVSRAYFAGDGDGRDLDPTELALADADCGTLSLPIRHGGHLAGLVGALAADNGRGATGAVWRVTVAPIRAVGRCGALKSDLNDAIRWAAGVEATIVVGPRGAPVVRQNPAPARIILIGSSFPAPLGCPRSTQDAVDAAIAAGAVIVAPAGNSGVDARAAAPGNCAGVLTVAAGDAAGRLAYYSNYGPRVDVMGPGGDMRQDVNGDGRPDGVLSASAARACVDPVTESPAPACDYAYAAGTSMAAAHVAGALALLAADHSDATRDELISLVVDTARSPRTPQDCPRPCGAGLLDLERAVGITP